jgi:peptidoglycan/LPS O-acetylase OafA/YrhL
MSICFRLWAHSSIEYSWFTLHVHTLSRIDVLILGAVCGFYYSQKPFEFRLNWIIRWLLFALLIFILSITPLYEWKSLLSAGFKKYVSIRILAVLLLDFNFNKRIKHLLSSKSVIHYIGKISYGL